MQKPARKQGRNIQLECYALASRGLLDKELAQFFVDECKDRRCDTYDDKRRDCPPNSIRIGKFPNGEDAEYGANDERNRDNDKRDPPNETGFYDAAAARFDLYNNVSFIWLHRMNYNRFRTAIRPVIEITIQSKTP